MSRDRRNMLVAMGKGCTSRHSPRSAVRRARPPTRCGPDTSLVDSWQQCHDVTTDTHRCRYRQRICNDSNSRGEPRRADSSDIHTAGRLPANSKCTRPSRELSIRAASSAGIRRRRVEVWACWRHDRAGEKYSAQSRATRSIASTSDGVWFGFGVGAVGGMWQTSRSRSSSR